MKIDFEFDTPYGLFCDALHFADDELPSQEIIESMKQQRLDNWLALIVPQVDLVTPSKE